MEIKAEGQVFTPTGIVTMILDAVKYTGQVVLTKKIMEPSFGKGAFLIEMVSRIIHEGRAEGKSSEEIKAIIEDCVYGIEKDEDLYHEAISKLNELLSAYDIETPSWSNLVCGDTLLLYSNYVNQMDFCVGNPPYVRIHNIDVEYRDVVKNFTYSKGTTDLYIIFYEIGLMMLKDCSGRLAYITPNSFLRNTSQKTFRNFLVQSGFLSAIYDFKDSKLFEADTYTCICVVDKNLSRITKDIIEYREYNMYKKVVDNKIKYSYFRDQLNDATWNLSSEEDILYLQANAKRPIKIKSIARVQNGIATNRDSVYVNKAWLDKDCTKPYMGKHTDRKVLVWFNDHQVESTILHRCVKASKFDGVMTNSYILFPYKNKPKNKLYKSNGVLVETSYVPYSENELQTKFPKAFSYLQDHWEDLESRDMDAKSLWFVFGRSQGLVNSGYKKLVFKHVVSKTSQTIDVHLVDEDVIVYSGIYITVDVSAFISPNGSSARFNDALYEKELAEVKEILSSDDFHKYCILVGKDMQGGYVSVSSRFVNDYGTLLTSFPNLPVNVPREDFPIADNVYMNRLFTERFVDCIKESYLKMGAYGTTSTERVKPFHAFLAKILKYKLGQEYDVIADGYAFGKEAGIAGNFDFKNVDVCVKKNDKVLGAIAFKLLSNNFKQNYKNFAEGLLGETAQMKGIGIPYAFCYLIPEVALYREDVNKKNGIGYFQKLDILTQNDVKIYFDIANDASYKNRTPDAMFIGIHKLFTPEYLDSLCVGDCVDISDLNYLDAIVPEWSDLNFIQDENIKAFYKEQLNIGQFLDKFIEQMGIHQA